MKMVYIELSESLMMAHRYNFTCSESATGDQKRDISLIMDTLLNSIMQSCSEFTAHSLILTTALWSN